jgi:FRG domain
MATMHSKVSLSTVADPVRHCERWIDFVETISSSFSTTGSRVLYRGQREYDWKLTSAWDRFVTSSGYLAGYKSIDSLEKKRVLDAILNQFRGSAAGLPGIRTHQLSEDQWWALGRHHGLITPLLDWTESPYVAAYFAFMDLAEYLNPGFRSGLCTSKQLEVRSEPVVVWKIQPSPAIEKVKVIRSRVEGSYRQRAQSGFFTRLKCDEHHDLELALADCPPGAVLQRITISGRAMVPALKSLYAMNITPATLFPDLDGAAMHANISYLLSESIFPWHDSLE